MDRSLKMIKSFQGRGGTHILKSCFDQNVTAATPAAKTFVTSSSAAETLTYNRDTGTICGTGGQGSCPSPMFHTVIGIEIHAQLSVPTKLFASSPTKHNKLFQHTTDIPNTTISAHNIGYPGTLPLLSRKSVL